jgi:hypothetical protein
MPVAEHLSQPLRGHKTICIPCSQREYEGVVGDPEESRKLLDQRIQDSPELFPTEIDRGYRMNDTYPARKTGHKLRRIERRNRQRYLVRPSFSMPSLSAYTEDVQAPLFSASPPCPPGP